MVSVKKFYLRGNIIPRVPARACPKIFKFNWIARYHEPGGYFITNISLHEFINNADDFKFNEVYRLEKLSFTFDRVPFPLLLRSSFRLTRRLFTVLLRNNTCVNSKKENPFKER